MIPQSTFSLFGLVKMRRRDLWVTYNNKHKKPCYALEIDKKTSREASASANRFLASLQMADTSQVANPSLPGPSNRLQKRTRCQTGQGQIQMGDPGFFQKADEVADCFLFSDLVAEGNAILATSVFVLNLCTKLIARTLTSSLCVPHHSGLKSRCCVPEASS